MVIIAISRPSHFVYSKLFRKTVEGEHQSYGRGNIQLTIIYAFGSIEILTLAIPYAIARFAIKDERKRINGCIVCFTLWLLASCSLLLLAFSYQFSYLDPFALVVFVLLMIILSYDLFTQVRFL